MPLKLYWDDEDHTISRIDFSGSIHMQELLKVWHQEAEMIRAVEYPVYSLNVFTNMQFGIPGVSTRRIQEFVRLHKPQNLQMTIQVAPETHVRRGLAMLAKLMFHRVYVLETLPEAYEIIAQHKAELARTTQSDWSN